MLTNCAKSALVAWRCQDVVSTEASCEPCEASVHTRCAWINWNTGSLKGIFIILPEGSRLWRLNAMFFFLQSVFFFFLISIQVKRRWQPTRSHALPSCYIFTPSDWFTRFYKGGLCVCTRVCVARERLCHMHMCVCQQCCSGKYRVYVREGQREKEPDGGVEAAQGSFGRGRSLFRLFIIRTEE